MKINIIYFSKTGNTKKVLDAIASVLKLKHQVRLIEVSEAKPEDANADLVGFASGIYAFNVARKLLKYVQSLPTIEKKAFIVSTSGAGNIGFHKKIKKLLTEKGFNVVNEFCCKGYDNWGPFKIMGGFNKGRPNEQDLEKAKDFAKSIF
ncbi:flavodoxin [Candidatus Woesearchaeota archaeon]|nr:flavodoxin [Candidatus Woesearchaeota archaeon]MBW3021761.1 flavodoxin [Candidatus Woesearchaeota archaeon]